MEVSRNNVLRVETVPIADLVPSPRNPRHMSAKQMSALQRSIAEYGVVDPIIARRQDHSVIGGHQRLEAARSLGFEEVPVVFLELSEAEAAALSLALNKISGDWDMAQLTEILAELRDLPDLDVTLTGFDAEELEDLFADQEAQVGQLDCGEGFDLASGLAAARRGSESCRARPGQIWQLGAHRLLCGDALEDQSLDRVCQGERVPLVVTDPPYGIDYLSRMAGGLAQRRPISNDGVDAFEQFLERTLPAVREQMARGATLYWFAAGGGPVPALGRAQLAIAQHFDLTNCLVWNKETPGLGWRWRSMWEAIIEATVGPRKRWHGGTHRANVLCWPKEIPDSDDHPTPKPVGLLAELVRVASRPGETVLDPFAGAGSTLVASELTGRRCRAVELDPHYCALTLSRWESLVGGKATLVKEAG